MKRRVIALLAGAAVVGAARLLGPYPATGPWVFRMLWPGLMLGALAPDSGYNPEGDVHPWGPISVLIVYAVDIALYAGLIYGLLSLVERLRRSAKNA